ncbi:MAG: NAD(+) synthase [Lachnospiraceae bacterium]|nr:NAD(+) synthase [Lachnospiraceae bacterium]
MKDGYIRVACATPKIRVADVEYNTDAVIKQMQEAGKKNAKVIVFPELVLTGYTCQDLFLQNTLLDGAMNGLEKILKASKKIHSLVVVGLPFMEGDHLYNVAAVLFEGELLALVPKKYLPNYNEFYEMRHFRPGQDETREIEVFGRKVLFGRNVIVRAKDVKGFALAVELCEDLWVPNPPSTSHALAGATIIANASASNEIVCKDEYRKSLVSSTSARLLSAYLYCSAGEGESTQDVVFSGHNMICENGSFLAESKRFTTGILYGDVDLEKIMSERRRMTTFDSEHRKDYSYVEISLGVTSLVLDRSYSRTPFVPSDETVRAKRCEDIFTIQSLGLKKRLEHTHCKSAVVGISGGLDSTLALLVIARAFDMLGLEREKITAVTMPCFGTTDRTYQNAVTLTKTLGATLREIDLKTSVLQHFEDIGHDPKDHSVTYENGQARERTQVLMDIANQTNGLVIGTGDLSELALGWATYNGDHMSMYGVNASIPKTLVRHLVRYYAETCGEEVLYKVLMDVLDTPVSPELLPPTNGTISQKTEDLVGPYELHDFFLYHALRFGYHPSKIFRMAEKTFAGEYAAETIIKWEKTFYRRFFAQHFKRSCLPDGPKVGSVAVSPRGDLRMPSDAVASLWLEEVEDIEAQMVAKH